MQEVKLIFILLSIKKNINYNKTYVDTKENILLKETPLNNISLTLLILIDIVWIESKNMA